jgi:hypothetical protein
VPVVRRGAAAVAAGLAVVAGAGAAVVLVVVLVEVDVELVVVARFFGRVVAVDCSPPDPQAAASSVISARSAPRDRRPAMSSEYRPFVGRAVGRGHECREAAGGQPTS